MTKPDTLNTPAPSCSIPLGGALHAPADPHRPALAADHTATL